MTPDLNELSSIRSLFDQVDFKRFRAFLERVEAEEIKRAIHAAENPEVARGRAQMIIWLRIQIETCKQSASAMEIRNDKTAPRRSGGI